MDIQVSVEGLSQVFHNGDGGSIIDVELKLGMEDNSSSCVVTLADLTGSIASLFIKHSLNTGGLPTLPKPVAQSQQNVNTVLSTAPVSSIQVPAGNGIISRGDGFPPPILAFSDLIAWHEVPDALGEQGYYARNFNGYFSKAAAAQGFPDGHDQNVGRYQFNYGDMQEAQRSGYKVPDFTPASQDQILLFKLKYRNVLQPLMAGDIHQAILNAGKEWSSMAGSTLKGGAEIASDYKSKPDGGFAYAIQYYNQRLAYYTGQAPQQPQVNKASVPAQESGGLTQGNGGLLPITYGGGNIVKGSKFIVIVDGVSFSYYHQGTETNEDGITRLHGQGVRWVLNRRKRNETHKETSLKALAQQIATAHKIQLNWMTPFDPTYEHIDQTGLTDYQLLLRECKNAGLVAMEDGLSLTVKQLNQVTDTTLVLQPGDNLISYHIEDKAMDASKEQPIDSLLQGENKVELDPISGQLKITKPDVDPIKDLSVSGSAVKQVAGKMTATATATAQQLRARMKRVKGLPSTFTIPITLVALSVTPLSVIRTKGLGGSADSCLNRAWVVSNITHKLSAGTTTLDCFSPVEVVDNSPQVLPSATPTVSPGNPMATQVMPSQGWIAPTTGIVTSYWHEPRSYELHPGTDIAADIGTPIVASAAGTVTYAATKGGYGLTIEISHPNGWLTRYGHASQLVAHVGQVVNQGDVVMLMGSTGYSTGSHLHMEYRNPQGESISPVVLGFPSWMNKGTQVNRGSHP